MRRLCRLSALLALLAGCAQQAPAPKANPVPAKGDGVEEAKQGAADPLEGFVKAPPGDGTAKAKKGPGGIPRRMEITASRQHLRQLGLAYQNFELTHNRGPKDRKELSPYYENNATINAALDKGDFVFHYDARTNQMPAGAANTLIAYEGVPDQNGIRVVLMANGQVQDMDEETFKKTPKAGK